MKPEVATPAAGCRSLDHGSPLCSQQCGSLYADRAALQHLPRHTHTPKAQESVHFTRCPALLSLKRSFYLEGHLGPRAARDRAPGLCDISVGFSTADLQAPELGPTLERPPPFTPRRAASLPPPRRIRAWRLAGGSRAPPTRPDGQAPGARPTAAPEGRRPDRLGPLRPPSPRRAPLLC